jgi:sugar lactone lactonase YvrE
VAGKGLLLNAIVDFYAVSNGTISTTPLATARTDSKTGAFSASVSSGGPVIVTVTTDSSTQMLDELSGTAIAAPTGLVLHAALDSLTNLQPIAVTPLTEMVYSLANSTSGGLTTANIDAAANAVNVAFLGGAPALNTQPIDITTYKSATAAQQELAKLLSALALAAKQGIATDASGTACSESTYAQQLVCMVGGLGNLLKLSSSGAGTLTSAANYIRAAYTQIDAGTITIAGGAPSALGLNTPTQAESEFETAVATQAPLPGYNSGASPLANTKALFADVRTNILDQASTNTFGLAPVAQAVGADYRNNVRPGIVTTGQALVAAKVATDILAASVKLPSAGSTADLNQPAGIGRDGAGNFYVADYQESTILKISASGVISPLAGSAWNTGTADGVGAAARFNQPTGLAVDPSSGMVYVADSQNDTIRKIAPDGTVTTLAGQAGVAGSVDGVGTAAQFWRPAAITLDPSTGNLYVTEYSTIRKIAPDGTVTTIAGLSLQAGEVDGQGSAARFNGPLGIVFDASSGNLYVADFNGGAIRKVTLAGAVTTIASQLNAPDGIAVDASGNLYVGLITPSGSLIKVTPAGSISTLVSSGTIFSPASVVLDSSGNLYVADTYQNSIWKVSASGSVTTFAASAALYKGSGSHYCGYDPVLLNTASNVVLCRYGDSNNSVLMTVTPKGSGAYDIKTQPLTQTQTFTPGAWNPITGGYTLSTSSAPLDAAFTYSSGSLSGSFTGPLCVTSNGGQVTANLAVAESSDWNATTGTGTLTPSGSISGGSGGVSLVSATIGTDSSLSVTNVGPLLQGTKLLSVSAAPSVQGTLDATVNTGAFSYAAKVTIGPSVLDKSGLLAVPQTVTASASIAKIVNGSTSPIFSGTVSLNTQGVSSFDSRQLYSATNFVTASVQVDGQFSLTGGRLLDLSATVNGSQLVPTPQYPDSLTVTYSYTTPSGTALLNATAQYDATNGYKGTITNNAGVTVTLTKPISGALSGQVTDNGQSTATIAGAMISYTDGTVESLL